MSKFLDYLALNIVVGAISTMIGIIGYGFYKDPKTAVVVVLTVSVPLILTWALYRVATYE